MIKAWKWILAGLAVLAGLCMFWRRRPGLPDHEAENLQSLAEDHAALAQKHGKESVDVAKDKALDRLDNAVKAVEEHANAAADSHPSAWFRSGRDKKS